MNSLLQAQFGDANLDDCDKLVALAIAIKGMDWYQDLFKQFEFDNGWR